MERALRRLQDPEGTALRGLAELVVRETTLTPIAEIAPPRWIASQIETVLQAIGRGELLQGFVERRIVAVREHVDGESRPLRDWWPEEVDEPARRVLRQGWTPGEDLTFRILDQPAMHALLTEILTGVLQRFRKKMQVADSGLLSGIGGRAARKGRGLFGGVAGNLGGLASNVVGAVRDEIEHGLDELVTEFVKSATIEVLQSIARYLANPKHEAAFADLRVGVLDVLLDSSVDELAEEFDRLHPLDMVEVIVAGMRSIVEQEDFVEQTTERIELLMSELGDGTLGAWLQEVELEQVWVETTTDLVTLRLQAVVRTEAFEAWWRALHAPD